MMNPISDSQLSSVSEPNKSRDKPFEENTKECMPKMISAMIYCPKCERFRGMWDMGDYWQCCGKKQHKIKKEDVK